MNQLFLNDYIEMVDIPAFVSDVPGHACMQSWLPQRRLE